MSSLIVFDKSEIGELTFAHHSITLISEGYGWRIVLHIPPRMNGATPTNSRILCGDLWPCRTRKSRLNLMPRKGPRSGSERLRLPLPALQATAHIRRVPFLPSSLFQSDASKSAFCQRSETLPAG